MHIDDEWYLRLVKGYYLDHYGKCFVFATKFTDRFQSPVEWDQDQCNIVTSLW